MKKVVAALLVAVACTAPAAEVFPARPVRIVVAASPGGLVDISTRLVAQKMAEKLGQPVIVENRAGADTLLGIRYVKGAPADGYTVLATSNSIASQPAVKLDPGYDLAKDFLGIGLVVRSPWVMVVGPSQLDRSVADFIARANAKPAEMSFASGGVGTTPYMAAAMFLQRAGVKLLHVPYKGNGAAIPDVISGRVTMIFEGLGSGAGKIRGGQLRALGVSSLQRLPAFPEIPTIAEQGLPNFSSYVDIGLLVPSGTPKDAVDKLSAALQAAITSKEVRERFEGAGAEMVPIKPQEYTEALKRETVQMGKLAAELGLQKQ
ncbi:Bug family tripartite tricarboxylate transporter substrate binding protein [Rhodoferax sediminis]|uniref:Tripartite tricarboxylate transporter substrate binding protein n=1 Tax=Rhodoferax sediminis TaxID=2509614 RepID=A0A515DDR1_9BURK|nr:tripartite tricarboxylate transporter substrate binding protein [Rhodoferax sediminis]QDL38562.1 tripartite tricarboxylate transporter substrate binding protein [Rhodoferax sediminis]